MVWNTSTNVVCSRASFSSVSSVSSLPYENARNNNMDTRNSDLKALNWKIMMMWMIIRLGFLPRSVWNKQTRIGPPSLTQPFLPAEFSDATPPPPPPCGTPIAWRSCKPMSWSVGGFLQGECLKTPPPPPPPPPFNPSALAKPSFGPAAEAACASVYNY